MTGHSRGENHEVGAEHVVFVVLDVDCCYLSMTLDIETALALIATVSDDPDSWREALDVWPRYRTPVVCEFTSSLDVRTSDRQAAFAAIEKTDEWVVLDFCQKRIVTGRGTMLVGRDEAFAMDFGEQGGEHHLLCVHLPPWWELHEQAECGLVASPRTTPIEKPHVDRDILFGDSLLNFIGASAFATVASDAWLTSGESESSQSLYPFTVAVHRDWLMTPREDLGGRMPRQLLHGAKEWSDRVVQGQRTRCENGVPIVAIPDDWAGYDSAPMGSEEMVMYFELCRELIGAAWAWCTETDALVGPADQRTAHPQLVEFLRDVRNRWLASSFEDGSPPSFIIECSRRRVPRGIGLPIEGMAGVQVTQHVADCNCPLCEMMDEGVFGVGFASIDGHHLDLDDDFAFSMHEHRKDWEEMLVEYKEFSAEFDRTAHKHDSVGDTSDGSHVDPFASAWSGLVTDEPIPGDPRGHLRLAFLLAEIISELEQGGVAPAEFRQLNRAFADFRTSGSREQAQAILQLKTQLELLAERYPALVARVADFQSRMDEQIRSPVWDDDSEFPF